MEPRDVVTEFLAAGLARNYERFIELMAPDGWIEWPHRPAGIPDRLRGRDEIRAFMDGMAEQAPIRITEHRDMVLYQTDDPEVVIIQYEAHGNITTTGAPYHQSIIAVIRVRDGLIVSYQDYLNPLALAEALATASA